MVEKKKMLKAKLKLRGVAIKQFHFTLLQFPHLCSSGAMSWPCGKQAEPQQRHAAVSPARAEAQSHPNAHPAALPVAELWQAGVFSIRPLA